MSRTPKADGFHVPAEWEPHSATLIGWPWRGEIWPEHGKRAWRPFLDVIQAVSTSEKVIVIPKPGTFTKEHRLELASKIENEQVEICPLPCDDAWMRDTAPTFIIDQDRKEVRGVDWTFNGWGHGFGVQLEHAYKDDVKVARAICGMFGHKLYSSDLICEGGALAYDGEGTVITTESVLLDERRNGGKKTKDEIQQILLSHLGAEKVIWVPRGLYGDDEKNTNGHIDNLVAFVAPAVVVLAWTDDETDPQFQRSKMAEDILKSTTDAKGRSFTIHRLHLPSEVVVTKKDVTAFTYRDAHGRDIPIEGSLIPGQRLPASYVNFYIANKVVVVPQFDQPKWDAEAMRTLGTLFPGRKIIGVLSREVLLGGGNIHCITHPVPLCS